MCNTKTAPKDWQHRAPQPLYPTQEMEKNLDPNNPFEYSIIILLYCNFNDIMIGSSILS